MKIRCFDVLCVFFKDFISLFLEGREGEREGDRHQCVVASYASPTRDLMACNPGMFPGWESNWRPFGAQARVQSTKLHQPGLMYYHRIFCCFLVIT